MRYLIILLNTIAFLTACHTSQKVQTIQQAFSKKDTAQIVVVKEIPTIDSAAIVKEIMEKVMRQKIDFKTFNAKIKVDYESANDAESVTAYMSLLKDSMLIVKISYPPFGNVANVLVTKESITLVQLKGDRYVQKRAIDYIKEVTQIPFDFSTLQDIIIGNPVFLDSNVVSYKNSGAQLLVLMIGDVFKHLVTLENSDFKILHSKLDDIDVMRNRTCDITFGTYKPYNSFQFATYRKISVAEKSKLDVYLVFDNFDFNEPLKYSFSIPKNIKRK
jgi:hypothetical protein